MIVVFATIPSAVNSATNSVFLHVDACTHSGVESVVYAVLISDFPTARHAVTLDESSCEHLRYVIELMEFMGLNPFLQRIVVVAPGEDSGKKWGGGRRVEGDGLK